MKAHPDFPYQLYLVISEADCRGRGFLEVAEQAILGGVDILQLREKNCSTETFSEKAILLKSVTDAYDIPLIINDDLQVAMRAETSGIHVGNNDVSPLQIRKQWKDERKIIGYSIEYLHQLESDNAKVSDYLGISPVFNTKTKTDTVTEWGLHGVEQIRQRTTKPLVAIGNIQIENAKAVFNAGADCIAVVSAICAAENPQKAAYELKNLILK